ncbi:MFS transporter [Streptosporangium lutulentum]|uniref:MFS family permease n=1 Tax=Streptosporangium lutulentum TaxID=1461250 RepID=A0ABT9QMY5_9ACTN|nr:MFS transporter [Streptosporangium lutulentum]MDP9848127.1 MFS family permease [Streptosporangium lutulentum]
MVGPRTRWGLLRDFGFRQLFIATTISQLGSQVSLLALPLVAVLALDASNFQVGALTACGTIAFLLVGLPAGAWVDRMRRRNVLIFGDIGRALVLGSVPLAWAMGALSMIQLYLVALVTGVLTVFFDVAYQSYLPHLVGREHLVEGNAKLEAVRATGQVAGPTLAGVVIQVVSAPLAVTLNALSFAASALFVRRIHTREELPARTRDTRLRAEVMEGLRFVFGNRLLRAIALSIALYNLLSAARVAMLLVLLARELHLSAGTIGIFYSIASVGSLLGALTATKIATRIGQGPAIWVPIAIAAPFQLLIPMAQPGWLLWTAACAYLVISCCVVVNNVTQVSFRQRLTPEHLLGRMNATMRFLVWGTTPIGALIGGVLGQLLGPRPTLWLAAIGAAIPVLPLILSPLRHLRELPTLSDREHLLD